MTKYIDAEKLKAEIERLRKTNIKALDADHITPGVFHGRAQALNYLFEFITSSQEEQPEVDLEKAARHVYESWHGGTMDEVRRDMVELGKVLNERKEK